MLFGANEKIVFIGDSITDADRRSVNKPWGLGYVNQTRDLLLARHPELKLSFVNKGIGGNTTRHLLDRWQADIIAQKPDWVMLMIGINDVWRQFDRRPASDAVPLAEYRANLHKLIEATKSETGARLVVLTPYMIEPDPAEPMRVAMDRYGAAVKEVASNYGVVLVDTQAAFDTALQHTTPTDWADDKIHPNGAGHAIIMLALLQAVGFDWTAPRSAAAPLF